MIDAFLVNRYLHQMPNLEAIILPVEYGTLYKTAAFGFPYGLMSYRVYYKYDPDCEIEKETDKKVEEIKGPLLKETSEETNEANQNNTNEKKPKGNISHSFSKPTHNENIKKALKKWRFWRNILIVG